MELPARHALLAVDARTEAAFLDAWAALAGAGGGDAQGQAPAPRPGVGRGGGAMTAERRPSCAIGALGLDAAATLGLALYSLRRRPRVRPGVRRLAVRRRRLPDRARRPRRVVPAAPPAAAGARRRAAHRRRRRLDDRLAGLSDDVRRDLPDGRDVGHRVGRPRRSSATSSRSPSRRSSTSAAGRCWPRSAPPSSCCRRTRSPSAPTPAARRSCPAPCCSCSSPRSAPTATGSP